MRETNKRGREKMLTIRKEERDKIERAREKERKVKREREKRDIERERKRERKNQRERGRERYRECSFYCNHTNFSRKLFHNPSSWKNYGSLFTSFRTHLCSVCTLYNIHTL